MISEEQAELLVERLIRRIDQANTYFLMKMGASVGKIRELTPSQAQQLVQILKYGGNYEDIVNEIAKYTNLNVKDIDDIFSAYAKKDQEFYKQFYQYRDVPYVPYNKNVALQRQTQALSNIVENEVYNFSRSNVLGYTIRDLDGTPQFLGLRDTYNRVLDEALLNVGQGKETFDSAMTRIMEDIGGSGLKTLEYESGRSVRLDSAVRMHLKSRLIELHNENQQLLGEEFGADGVEITVHGNPADDHAEVQGRQFTINQYDGNGNLIKEGEWEKLQAGLEATDYNGKTVMIGHSKNGSHRPIGEYNCYHRVFSVVLGVSKPEYNDEQLQDIIENNNKGFEFEGKHYTNYEGTQLQRMIERKIREHKDTQILAKASGNDQLVGESQLKITQLTRKYKQLSDASGLPTKMERMKVSGYRRSKINKTQKINENEFKEFKIEAPARDYPEIGEKYFNYDSNDSLDTYISQSSHMGEKMENDLEYKKEMFDIAKNLEELKFPVKENIVLYSGQPVNTDLTQTDFVISTTVGKTTAQNGYIGLALNGQGELHKIYVEAGAKLVSTYNTKRKQFNFQGELIIPISGLKKLVKIGENTYLYKK